MMKFCELIFSIFFDQIIRFIFYLPAHITFVSTYYCSTYLFLLMQEAWLTISMQYNVPR